ncbi:MAG: ATP-binding cassette domain-containing protein [Candidatus Nanoarchaeia archaeon]
MKTREMGDIVKVENLTKKFGDLIAVNKISLNIKQGEIFGLLGPNGAGKSTTISMLATILRPTSGDAFINNFEITKNENEVRQSIGIVFQDPSLDDQLTAYENMNFHGRLYHIPKKLRKERITQMLNLVGLENRSNDLIKTFSGGMRRRLEIARGLMHNPKVLFLDEPTLGLDPQTRNRIWDYIKKLNKEKGVTVILTTHYMDEADKLCDNIAIINRGKIIATGNPKSLKESIGGDMITIESTKISRLKPKIKKFSWIKSIQEHDGSITINLNDSEKHVAEIVKISDKEKIPIDSISMHEPSLEDVFLHFTGKTMHEEEADPKERMRLRHNAWSGARR